MPKRVADYIKESGDEWEIFNEKGKKVGKIYYSIEDSRLEGRFILVTYDQKIPIDFPSWYVLAVNAELSSRKEIKQRIAALVDLAHGAALWRPSYPFGHDMEGRKYVSDWIVKPWIDFHQEGLRRWKQKAFAWLEVREWLDLLVEE